MSSRSLSSSWIVYFSLVLVLVVIRVFFLFVSIPSVLTEQAYSFSWPALLVFSALGLIGTWAASKSGFPESWDKGISNRQRLLYPALLGLGAGLIALAFERLQPLGPIDAPFPLSIPFYIYGAIVSEFLMRLFLLTVPLWFISTVLLRNRWQEIIFWATAIFVSLIEPLSVLGGLYELGTLANGISLGVWAFVGFAYGINLLFAYQFRKHGLIAVLVLRMAFYLVWHILT